MNKKGNRSILVLLLAFALVLTGVYSGTTPAEAAAKMTLDRTELTLKKGMSQTLKINALPSNATVKWSSSKKAVVKVGAKGKVTAVKLGTAVIKAKVTVPKKGKTPAKTTTLKATVHVVSAEDYRYSDDYYLAQAKKLGIAPKSLYNDLDREMSYVEYLTMLKNAHDLQYGKNSNGYIDGWLYYQTKGTAPVEERTNPIPLGRIVEIASMADAYYFRGVERDFKTDFWAAMDGIWEACDLPRTNDYLWDSHDVRLGLGKDGSVTNNITLLIYNSGELELTGWPNLAYMMMKYDRVSYDTLIPMPEDHIFREKETMSLRDGILLVFHYYRSLYPLPEYVPISEAGVCREDIITEELINKKSTLPDASNKHLPVWHGTVIYYNDGTWGALFGQPDMFLNERDFQIVHEAGFNMVRIFTSWYHLQDPYKNTPNKVRLDDATKNDPNVVNLRELEHWDRIIAWGMKYDIHVQICFQDTPGLDSKVFEAGWDEWFGTDYCADEIFVNEAVQKASADWFRMLAKRYAKVPAKYLSFNLINECDPESDEIYAKALKPTVDAIWEESPERIIVADVRTHMPITGEGMAELGCAISYHDYEPGDFAVIDADYARQNPDYYPSMTWPYVDKDGNVYDAESCRTMVPYTVGSYEVVKNVAEKYGVGFMVNEFGYFYSGFGKWEGGFNPEKEGNLPIQSTDVLQAYLRDKIEMYEKDGVGWTSGAWLGLFADEYTWPVADAEWYRPKNYHYVFDKKKVDFWKEINGVK